MDVRFLAPDLRKLDRTRADAIAVAVCEDERPLRGATGLLDWRLNGWLSKLVARRWITGRFGEKVLVPCAGRLPCDGIVLVGAGPSAALDCARAGQALDLTFEVLDGLRVRHAVLALPGRTWPLLDAEAVMSVASSRLLAPHEQDSLIVIDDPDQHRAMQRALENEKRRLRAAES